MKILDTETTSKKILVKTSTITHKTKNQSHLHLKQIIK